MQKSTYKKRFIAGANCPCCKETDKIFTFFESEEEDAKKWRACANCDFEEALSDTMGSHEELNTRVNQLRVGEQPLAHEVAIEEVKFIDPSKS